MTSSLTIDSVPHITLGKSEIAIYLTENIFYLLSKFGKIEISYQSESNLL